MKAIRQWLARNRITAWLRIRNMHGNGLLCTTPCQVCTDITDNINYWAAWGFHSRSPEQKVQ